MMNDVVASLQKEHARLQAEIGRVGKALAALGYSGGKLRARRTLSKEARERIAAAQRLRWAKARKAAAAK